jgi:hypothetical protein
MSTYNNVLGNFISPSDDLSDLDDDEDNEDSASEPEPEMGSRNMSSQPDFLDKRTQLVETLPSKSNKYTYIHLQIHNQGFLFIIPPLSQYARWIFIF